MKKQCICMSVVLGLLLPLISASSADAANLISRYEFENDFTNSVSGAPDGTGNNSPSFVTGPNGFGQAVSFNGTNQYVGTTTDGLPQGDGTYPENPLTKGTIAFWVNTTSNQGGAETSFFGTYNDDKSDAINIRQNAGGNEDSFNFYLSDDTEKIVLSSSDSSWRSGEWTHYAITWDAYDTEGASTADPFKFFVNGVEQSATIGQNDSIDRFYSWEFEPTIGARNVRGTVDQHFDGAIDDFRVYDGALTESEIQNQVIPEPSTLVLLALGGMLLMKRRRR